MEKLANIIPEQTGINKHNIELKKGKQPPYRPIYSLGPVELKSFKTYIKTYLANGFIMALKLLAGTPILFVCKPNGSFCLYVSYQGLNNPIIKNELPLPLICKFLD